MRITDSNNPLCEVPVANLDSSWPSRAAERANAGDCKAAETLGPVERNGVVVLRIGNENERLQISFDDLAAKDHRITNSQSLETIAQAFGVAD